MPHTAPDDIRVDARHVHKKDPRGVLVTAARSVTTSAARGVTTARALAVGDVWQVDAHLPLAESQGEVFAHADALVIAVEALRQAGIAHAHVAAGVPVGHRFIASHMGLTWLVDPGFLGTAPVDVTFAIVTEEVRHQRGRLVRHVFTAALLCDGVRIARGTGSLQVVEARVYERLRAGATPWSEVSAHHDPSSLLGIATTDHELTARLGWSASDPITFDHGNDHMPAMHLARTALAAHHALDPASSPTGLLVRCTAFVELGGDVAVRAVRTAHGGVETTFAQSGVVAATVVTTDDVSTATQTAAGRAGRTVPMLSGAGPE
ncbi:AfsA-related hotdog domain-containing protein [Xylanimonas protaetiae]|uniref:A-factor biosynthesis hotdog domain-containing protein n=1 Tax=Xylanimonas protaetiae TaxID=2509457 RepID=A0A4P6F1Y8_9MICO|nr:AfsA-related hotdog domain-containing protein [Xylanimonas protaetiae]QAY68713.1 hypothetical protein ET471_00525 [Xylanimonas protaetiae]